MREHLEGGGYVPVRNTLAEFWQFLQVDLKKIAAIACFPYVETGPEAHVRLDPYPGIVASLARCRALRGWARR